MSSQISHSASPTTSPISPSAHPPSPSLSTLRAHAQHVNQMTAVYFTASILALSAIVIIAHFLNDLYIRLYSRNTKSPTNKFVVAGRYIRSWLIFKIPLFTDVGHALVFAAYLAINIALILQNLDLTRTQYWAKRMGWIITCNLALITFLALKNTPLAFLSAYSYERLNVLHQAAGYCTVFFTFLHAILQIRTFSMIHLMFVFTEKEQIMGIVAGCAMLITLIAAVVIRKFQYEVFYVTHVVMFMLIIIVAGMHRPDLATKSSYIIIFAGSIWAVDRILRGSRMLWYSVGNRATIHPLAHGGVRIVMGRTPWRAVPGAHVFLWIPKARALETHPFTIVSTNPLELVVSPHDGFTRDLAALAISNPGVSLRASCDGPYGTLPKFSKFDHVILVAGGSGATFTFGVALNLLRRVTEAGAGPVIHFIWAIRDNEMQTWFEKELAELTASPMVNLSIYVTRSTSTRGSNSGSDGTITKAHSFDKSETDPEKLEPEVQSPSTSQYTRLGRPDIKASIQSMVSSTEEHERTVVAACGPDSLMRETRSVVSGLVASSGRSVTLHCEQFGW